MNNYLETEPKKLFSKVRARYIFLSLFLIVLGFGLLLGLTIRILRIFNPDLSQLLSSSESYFWIGPIFYYIVPFGVVCWLVLSKLKANKISLKYIFGKFSLKKKEWKTIGIVFLASQLFFAGTSQLTIFFTTLIFPDSAKNLVGATVPISIYDGNNLVLKIISWSLIFVMVVIVAPIAEEFLFRGIIMHRWATKWGVIPGILLSSFCFGLMHFNIAFMSLAIWSVFLALLYVQTGSLIVPIIAHALNNFLVFISQFAGNTSTSIDYEAIATTNDLLWRGLICIFLASIPLYYWLKWLKFTKLEHLPYFSNQKR